VARSRSSTPGQPDALAGVLAELDDDGDLAEGVLAAGDGVDAELAQARVEPVAALMARKTASIGAVAGEGALDDLAVGRAHADRRVRRPARGGLDVEPLQRVGAGLLAQLVGDERLEVHRGDLLLLVRELLEALEGGVQRLAVDLVAQLLQGRAQRVAAGVLAEDELVGRPGPTVVASMIS
jgi:hypothetical protein